MRRRPVLLLAALLVAVLAACGSEKSALAPFDDRRASAQELFQAYADLLIAKDQGGLDALLGESFIIQRANGTWQDRASYLSRLPDLTGMTFGNMVEARGVDAVTGRMDVAAELVVDGQSYPFEPAPMLVAFAWRDGRWQLDAQANFANPDKPSAPEGSASPSRSASSSAPSSSSASSSASPTGSASPSP